MLTLLHNTTRATIYPDGRQHLVITVVPSLQHRSKCSHTVGRELHIGRKGNIHSYHHPAVVTYQDRRIRNLNPAAAQVLRTCRKYRQQQC